MGTYHSKKTLPTTLLLPLLLAHEATAHFPPQGGPARLAPCSTTNRVSCCCCCCCCYCCYCPMTHQQPHTGSRPARQPAGGLQGGAAGAQGAVADHPVKFPAWPQRRWRRRRRRRPGPRPSRCRPQLAAAAARTSQPPSPANRWGLGFRSGFRRPGLPNQT